MTDHDQAEQATLTTTFGPISWTRLANAANITNYTGSPVSKGGRYYEVQDSNAYGVSMAPQILLDEIGLGWIGLSANYQYSIAKNAGQTLENITLDPYTHTYPEEAIDYTRYLGTDRVFDAGGYVNIQPFDYSVPDGYELRWHMPLIHN